MRYGTLFLAILLGVVGCGRAVEFGPDKMASADYAASEAAVLPDVAGQVASTDASAKATPLARKIIYTAELTLLVEAFDPIPPKVAAVARQFDGYVARSDVSGAAGRVRTGTWTLRVPVDNYATCLAALRQLGEVERESADSKDVSEEFYDLGARIRNKQRQEDRLVKLLEEATGELKQVLAVEQELARVRGEIEQMEGRLRVLSDLTAMTTINLTVRSLAVYEKPEQPSFGTRARRTFDTSYKQLVATGQALVLMLISLSVWLPVFLVIGLVVWGLIRRSRRRRTKRIHVAEQVEP